MKMWLLLVLFMSGASFAGGEVSCQLMTKGRVIVKYDDQDVTVGDLKKRIAQIEGIPAENLNIIFGGMVIEDSTDFRSLGLDTATIVHVVISLRGAKSQQYGDNYKAVVLNAREVLLLVP